MVKILCCTFEYKYYPHHKRQSIVVLEEFVIYNTGAKVLQDPEGLKL